MTTAPSLDGRSLESAKVPCVAAGAGYLGNFGEGSELMLETKSNTMSQAGAYLASSTPRVLLIDDDIHVSKALARVLRQFCEVEIVLSVDEAEQRLASGSEFTLILCDLLLPQRGGLELYRGLVATNSKMARKLAFMTGLGDDAEEAEEFREVPCLGKPLDMARVRALLDAFS